MVEGAGFRPNASKPSLGSGGGATGGDMATGSISGRGATGTGNMEKAGATCPLWGVFFIVPGSVFWMDAGGGACSGTEAITSGSGSNLGTG